MTETTWVAFLQDGMTEILHGKVIRENNKYLTVKCKNGRHRYPDKEKVLGYFNTKEECYNFDKTQAPKIRYMRCEHCNTPLREGTKVITDKQTIGAYCNIVCWAKAKGRFQEEILTNELITESWGLSKWDSE